jgi:hypothetical protein
MTGGARGVCMAGDACGGSSDWIAASLALLAMTNAFCLLENRLFEAENSEKPMVSGFND